MKVFYSAICFLLITQNLYAQDVFVSTDVQLAKAFHDAIPGTRIVLSPGNYSVSRLNTQTGGMVNKPIVVEAEVLGSAIISARSSEAFSVHHPFWVFKGLTIKGGIQSDHAFHISYNADNVIIQQNTLLDFHSHIKVNGDGGEFPDNGVIADNDIFNSESRHTSQPVALIDIVGGKNWIVRGNYIADFYKEFGNKTSYGLFMKGNSSKGLIEKNLVICSKNTQGGTRIGISFGGGGTGTPYCEHQDCNIEHTEGVIRNNIILNCSDVGIYLNKAHDSIISNNTLLMTTGIDVRFPQSNATVTGNILTGAIRERDGGTAETKQNVYFGTQLGMWLPAFSEKLQHRISDYNVKFPNWINQKNITDAQRMIENFFVTVEKTSFGLGQEKTQNCFPGLILGDLKPDKTECGTFWLTDEFSNEIDDDFWGHKRLPNQPIMGAIDFNVSTCDVVDRIHHRLINLLNKCLD